jgi:hypothetical protein
VDWGAGSYERMAAQLLDAARVTIDRAGPDGDALTEAFGPLGFSLAVERQQLAFVDRSARAFLDAEIEDHPVWVAARAVLEQGGEMQAARDRALEILEAANEDAARFRVSSSYVLVTLTRDRGAPRRGAAARSVVQ